MPRTKKQTPSPQLSSGKVVDATHLCGASPKCTITYAEVMGGIVAIIRDHYGPARPDGPTIHYAITDLPMRYVRDDSKFKNRCLAMAADPETLAQFIYDNQ